MDARRFIITLLFNVIYFKNILAEIDSTAILLECEKNSSVYDYRRKIPPYYTIDNCNRKIRITLNITNTGKTPPELAYTFVGHLADPETASKMYLLNPIIVRLRQEQVLLAYPFRYLTAVNARAKEIVLNYENRKNFTGCDDTSLINPTCGVKHDRGKAIQFSEGFCCPCPQTPVNEKQTRGGQDCSLDVGDPTDIEKQKFKASAHCLEFNNLWYAVSAVSEPFILHETFLQIYVEKHFKNSSSKWFALTHEEDFALNPKNTYQYDDEKSIVISYITSDPSEKAITVPFSQRRLLTPQPMVSLELSQLPKPVKNGANDYLLLPKSTIDSEGDVCDVAGVSYKAFATQPDKCNVPKTTCLKNQPLDFWDMDDEKREAGTKGEYLLENFAIPYKDPIIVDPETKDHWLALEHHEFHHTVIIVEVNADEIGILAVGKHAQISKITSSTIDKTTYIRVSILNSGLMPAKFTVQAVKCAYGVPDSSNDSIPIAPQMTKDISITTKPGSTSLTRKFACTVQVSSQSYGVVAKREVIIDPRSRCICNFHCQCTCMSDSLNCELMSEEDYQAAGFRGSLPILTAKPPYRIWFVAHPYLALLAVFLFLILFGFIKGIFGMAGCKKIGYFGMDKILYRPVKIKKYPQPRLRHRDPIYDSEGYPIHPDMGERVEVISEEFLFIFNVLFLFYWPCLMCKKCCVKSSEMKKKLENDKKEITSINEKKTNKKSTKQENTGNTSEVGESYLPGHILEDEKKREQLNQHRRSVSDTNVKETPVIPPSETYQEPEQWYPGKTKIAPSKR